MDQQYKKSAASVADEVAAAEANLRAAQERLNAARLRYEQGQQMGQASYDYQTQEAPSAQAPRPQAYAPYSTQASFAPQKDHIAAGVFAILLGVFGIHKFYMGKTNAGFITLAISIVGSLITFGAAAAVMSLIGIVEGIIYLAKPQDQFLRDYVQGSKAWF